MEPLALSVLKAPCHVTHQGSAVVGPAKPRTPGTTGHLKDGQDTQRPMARAMWAQQPLRGSPGVLEYPYCHQMMTQTHPGDNRRI